MIRGAAMSAITIVLLLVPRLAGAQIEQQEQEYLEKAQVTSASPSTEETDAWSGVTAEKQTLTVQVLSGPDAGTTATFVNDYTQVKTGDLVYVRHTTGGDAPDMWSLSDTYRLNVLLILALVFLGLVFAFGGLQGMRGLVSLAGSLALIFYLLLPGIYAGYSALWVSIGVASLIIIVGSYVTHGWNRTTSAAVLSMIITVLITGLGSYWVVHAAALSGFTSETNAYLNINTSGKIDMVGLLLGGIMIGLLGVLYDIAIGQAVAVEELYDAGKHLSRAEVYRKGIRIGREHIGALINTLAIAYVGVSLPLLLLFRNSNAGLFYMLNSELFSSEVIRILMGGIGLILAVPITTLVASYLLEGRRGRKSNEHSHHH